MEDTMTTKTKAKPANARQEISFTVGEDTFLARPTFLLQQAIEVACNTSIIPMAARVGSMQLSLSEIAVITQTVAQYSDKPPANSDDPLFYRQAVYEHGWQNLIAPVGELLMAFMTSGSEKKASAGDEASPAK